MARVGVKIDGLTADWATACKHAVTHLNALFTAKHIKVVLEINGVTGPIISVRTDPSIQGTAVHGRTTSVFDDSGTMLNAEVRLPVEVLMSTPAAIRNGGLGVLEVIAGHEFVHAIGHGAHNSHLMAQTMYKEAGGKASQDRLKGGTVYLPPLSLSPESIDTLQSIWK